ncbi:MAG TPA: HAD-IA family hydrolase [Candidatus Limnocylindria bacterium]|nr:HAD-IA family hydrolase [Candidatus Limnocylindria bacterium]
MTEARSGQPLRAVFLDIGDTVMRPNPSWEHVYAIAFREYGVDVEVDDLRAALRRAYHHGGFGFDDRFEASEESSFARTMEIDRSALAELGVAPMPEAFFRRLSELFMLTSNWHVFPDVAPALAALRERGLVVGAVSNWVWQLPELLHALDLVSHFDFIAASSRIGFEKPHPEIFRWALEQARSEPAQAIHVGDHLDADVDGARGAGIAPVLIDRRDRFAPGDLPDGTPLIRSLAELIPIVDARLPARATG